MPLTLVPPRPGRSPNWRIRGTHLGVYVDRSARTGEKRAAARILAALKAEIEAGAVAGRQEPRFDAAALAYMKAGGERRFLAPILEHWGAKPLREIDQQAVDRAALALYPDASPATRNRQVHTPVCAVLRQAGHRLDLRRPKGAQGQARTRWLTPAEAKRLLAHAGDLRPLVVTLLYTGLRLSEALGLRHADIDLKAGFAWVGRTKTGTPRGVYLPPVVVRALKRQANQPRPLPWRKGAGLYKPWRAMAAAAGLAEVTPHVLRHTYATWMRRFAGLDAIGLLATGAWADAKSVHRYTHTTLTEEARRADHLPGSGAKSGQIAKTSGISKPKTPLVRERP